LLWLCRHLFPAVIDLCRDFQQQEGHVVMLGRVALKSQQVAEYGITELLRRQVAPRKERLQEALLAKYRPIRRHNVA
jgi:hypothetical protein